MCSMSGRAFLSRSLSIASRMSSRLKLDFSREAIFASGVGVVGITVPKGTTGLTSGLHLIDGVESATVLLRFGVVDCIVEGAIDTVPFWITGNEAVDVMHTSVVIGVVKTTAAAAGGDVFATLTGWLKDE